MKHIPLSPDLKLPLDSVLLKKAILAKSGAGKSNTAAVYVEGVLDAGVQVIILDPKGDWWGLKSSADGKSEGYPIHILGGDRGDIPLEPVAGAVVAQSLVESGASAILDVSDFSKGEMFRFVGDFCTAFYKAKKKKPTPVLLVFEEADEMAPQKLPPSTVYGAFAAICLGAIEKIVKRGRFIGIGPLVVTQRSASLNKDVLTQTDCLILQQTTAPQDVDAVDAWIEHHPDQEKRKQVLATIQALPIGDGYVWCPALDLFKRTHFSRRRTFDSGQTPKIGEVRAEPKVMAKADMERLKGQMATLVEEAKANDPAALKAKVAALERELRNRKVETLEKVVEVEKVVERQVPYIPDEVKTFLAHLADRAPVVLRTALSFTESIPVCSQCKSKPAGPNGKCLNCSGYVGVRPRPTPPPTRSVPKPAAAPAKKSKGASDWSEALNGPMKRILDAVAWFDAIGIPAPKKEAVAFKAGYRPGGGAFQNPLGALRNEKANNPWPPLISYGNGTISLTAEGREQAIFPEKAGTAAEIQQAALDACDGPMRKILQVAIEAYPNAISKVDLAQKSGYAEGGGAFQNPLGRLRSCSLIEYPEKGMVKAEPLLFLQA